MQGDFTLSEVSTEGLDSYGTVNWMSRNSAELLQALTELCAG